MALSEHSGIARLFLIRHADAGGYREDPVLGNHLTEMGAQQARALAERVSAWRVDAIICSDLHRAHETALALHQHHRDVPLSVDSTFRELDIRFDQTPRDMPGFLRECELSQRRLEQRLERAWAVIRTMPYDVAVVVSHRRMIKYLIGRAIGDDHILTSRLQIANAGITAVEIGRAHGHGILRFVNDTTHLTSETIPQLPGAPWVEERATGHWLFGKSEFEVSGDCRWRVGQWVKVRGTAAHDGTFIALEVILKPAKNHAGLEGIIQNIDHHESLLRLVNKDVRVPRDEMSRANLQQGDAVKVSGRWRHGEFVPQKIKVKNKSTFGLEEIEGPIGRINSDSRFEALGLSVAINEKTSVEGLLNTHHGAVV